MMKDENKSKKQLIAELRDLREQITSLEVQISQSRGVESERKPMVQELGASEEYFHTIFDRSNDAIFIIDPAQDEILDANPRACNLLGYSREELLSMPISAIHPKEMAKLLDFYQSVSEQGHGWTDELTCLTKIGQILPSEISASVTDISGQSRMIALVRDITERHQREMAETLGEVAKVVNSSLELNEVLDQVLLELEKVLSYDSAAVMLLKQDILRGVAGRGFADQEVVMTLSVPLAPGRFACFLSIQM